MSRACTCSEHTLWFCRRHWRPVVRTFSESTVEYIVTITMIAIANRSRVDALIPLRRRWSRPFWRALYAARLPSRGPSRPRRAVRQENTWVCILIDWMALEWSSGVLIANSERSPLRRSSRALHRSPDSPYREFTARYNRKIRKRSEDSPTQSASLIRCPLYSPSTRPDEYWRLDTAACGL